MRPIDADALFDAAFKIWGTEADVGETNLFMEMINNAPTIAPPPNDPLTLAELREMDGEPVWVERHDGGPSRWVIVGDFESLYGVYFGTAQGGLRLPYDEHGKTWVAYRRRPEEGTT